MASLPGDGHSRRGGYNHVPRSSPWIFSPLTQTLNSRGVSMSDVELTDRAATIRERLTQLRDSL